LGSQRFNRRHGRVGHLFQGRYKAFLIDVGLPSCIYDFRRSLENHFNLSRSSSVTPSCRRILKRRAARPLVLRGSVWWRHGHRDGSTARDSRWFVSSGIRGERRRPGA